MGEESVTTTLEGKPVSIFQPAGAETDERAIQQFANCMVDPRAIEGALCADHHLGYGMPIGCVIKYDGAISPTGVGFDIGCGNMAVQTDIQLGDLIGADCPVGTIPFQDPEDFNAKIKPVMRAIQKRVEFGMGRSAPIPVDHDLYENELWDDIVANFGVALYNKARAQLGTVGAGNHYVDLLVDGAGWVWVANHFGSRGLGHTIASGFMAASKGLEFTERTSEPEEPIVFHTDTDLGQFYIQAMKLAGDYAHAGREHVMQQVLEVLGASAQFTVHNHHNYAWLEDGYWVVRKGATPLTLEPAFIGGSMGDISVIVQGTRIYDDEAFLAHLENPDADSLPGESWVKDIGAIGSAPHGAGRQMSRNAAAGKPRKMWSCQTRDCDYAVRAEAGVTAIPECPKCGNRKFKKLRMRDKSTAAIDWATERAKLNARGITVLGADADEAPGAYKSLLDVIAAHSNIEIMFTLRPIGVVMAGPEVKDFYKD